MTVDPELGAVLLATFASLFISSIAGYGGSLLLVPVLGVILGPKEGVALAALLLGWNNVFKVIAYRRTLALREGWALLLVTAVGVWFGAQLLISASDRVVVWSIVAATIVSLAVDAFGADRMLRARRHTAVPLMGASAVLSGVSGSSGPLKGISVRSLNLPRLEHVGLASSVSLVADALKVELFANAGLFEDLDLAVLAVALPVMPVGAWVGRAVNRRLSESAFRWIFWSVVGGYTLRMAGVSL
jgi:uncharacterized membrane protein YfcA